MSEGLNPEPCASYSLAGRFVCGCCGSTPNIVSVNGRDPMTITFECHGKKTTGSFSKADLVFNQTVFEASE